MHGGLAFSLTRVSLTDRVKSQAIPLLRRFVRSALRHRVVRYACLGGCLAAIDLLFFSVFAIWVKLPYLWVNAAGFTISTFLNYFLSIRWVFQSGTRYQQESEIVLVFLISGIALALNQLLLYIFVDVISVQLLHAKVFTIACVFFWNYLARHHLVFGAKQSVT